MDYEMITAQGLDSTPYRILDGSKFIDSAPYQILEGSGCMDSIYKYCTLLDIGG